MEFVCFVDCSHQMSTSCPGHRHDNSITQIVTVCQMPKDVLLLFDEVQKRSGIFWVEEPRWMLHDSLVMPMEISRDGYYLVEISW